MIDYIHVLQRDSYDCRHQFRLCWCTSHACAVWFVFVHIESTKVTSWRLLYSNTVWLCQTLQRRGRFNLWEVYHRFQRSAIYERDGVWRYLSFGLVLWSMCYGFFVGFYSKESKILKWRTKWSGFGCSWIPDSTSSHSFCPKSFITLECKKSELHEKSWFDRLWIPVF